jgi:hypothetical protein
MWPPFDIDVCSSKTAREELQAGGVFVPHDSKPPLFEPVSVRLQIAGDDIRTLKGQVVNHTPTGFYVLLESQDKVTEIITFLAERSATHVQSEEHQHPEEQSISETEEAGTDGQRKRHAPAWELIDQTSPISIRQQIANLKASDKVRLAKAASRPVRAILVRDVEKRLHIDVVKNPQCGDDELLEYSGIANLSPAALRWISQQRKQVRRPEVRWNLVLNPQTPQDVAVKLLAGIPSSRLHRILHHPRARERVQRAARKRLMQEGHI